MSWEENLAVCHPMRDCCECPGLLYWLSTGLLLGPFSSKQAVKEQEKEECARKASLVPVGKQIGEKTRYIVYLFYEWSPTFSSFVFFSIRSKCIGYYWIKSSFYFQEGCSGLSQWRRWWWSWNARIRIYPLRHVLPCQYRETLIRIKRDLPSLIRIWVNKEETSPPCL